MAKKYSNQAKARAMFGRFRCPIAQDIRFWPKTNISVTLTNVRFRL
jgi:hypothetical protein